MAKMFEALIEIYENSLVLKNSLQPTNNAESVLNAFRVHSTYSLAKMAKMFEVLIEIYENSPALKDPLHQFDKNKNR